MLHERGGETLGFFDKDVSTGKGKPHAWVIINDKEVVSILGIPVQPAIDLIGSARSSIGFPEADVRHHAGEGAYALFAPAAELKPELERREQAGIGNLQGRLLLPDAEGQLPAFDARDDLAPPVLAQKYKNRHGTALVGVGVDDEA